MNPAVEGHTNKLCPVEALAKGLILPQHFQLALSYQEE